jgi:hypothetical protein
MEFPIRREDHGFQANRYEYGFQTNKYEYHKDLFHAIYFVDYISGSLLLSTKFSENSKVCRTNEDLISSFLNAINLFIREISENKDNRDEIQEINFKDTRILYERKDRLMIIGISKKNNIKIEREILKIILEDFYNRFEQKITNFKGFIDQDILNYKYILNTLDFGKGLRLNEKF